MALIDNIIAYWKTDESSGNAASEVGGFTLTNNGTTAYSAGKINNAADFGASNTTKSLTSANTIGLDMSINFTQNCWVNITTAPGVSVAETWFLWSNNTTANKKGSFGTQYYNNAGTFQLYINRADSTANDQTGANQTLNVGTWYMLTITWNGTNNFIYLNGSGTPLITNASTRTGTDTTSGYTEGVQVGNDTTNVRWLSGLVDECGVWSRVLTSTEITELYNSGAGLSYPFSSGPTNLKSYNTNLAANIKSIDTNLLANIKSLNTNV